MMVGFVGRTGAGDRSGRIFFKSNQHDPLGAGVGAIWKSTLARGDPGSDAHEEPNNECRTMDLARCRGLLRLHAASVPAILGDYIITEAAAAHQLSGRQRGSFERAIVNSCFDKGLNRIIF
jgi:hypothetical protein